MKNFCLKILSLAMIFSLVSCDDDDQGTDVPVPVIRLETASVSESSLTINVFMENATEAAYVFSDEPLSEATPEAVFAQNNMIDLQKKTIVLTQLADNREYTIRAAAAHTEGTQVVYSQVAELKVSTSEIKGFALRASLDFGCSLDELKAAAVKAGHTVGEYDAPAKMLTVKTPDAVQPEIKYFFDIWDKYTYALVSLALEDSAEAANTYLEQIKTAGWQDYKPHKDWEYVLRKDGTLLRFFARPSEAQKTPALMVGKVDEDILSWTRMDVLEDPATGMFTPLVALGGPLDLITKYEMYQGHPVNEDRTNPARQFYAFDTGNEKFPMVGYWMDIPTNTFLDECALYVDLNHRPTPAQVEEYILSLGFEFTGLADPMGNPLYYKEDVMTVCCPDMIDPKDGPFAPKLRFYIQDLTDQLPKATVDIPWPNTDFGKITMTEAIAWYEAKGYTVDPTGFSDVFPLVKTTSPDFPTIVLLPSDADETIYFAASVMTPDAKVIHSPDIEKQLLDHGYKYVESAFLPTYHNVEIKVSAQVDNSGMLGVFSIGFNPIGA